MTAQEFIEQEYGDSYFNPDPDSIPYLMERYARLMCDKQRFICAESVRLDIIPDKYSLTGKRLTPCKESITNAPYPEELL